MIGWSLRPNQPYKSFRLLSSAVAAPTMPSRPRVPPATEGGGIVSNLLAGVTKNHLERAIRSRNGRAALSGKNKEELLHILYCQFQSRQFSDDEVALFGNDVVRLVHAYATKYNAARAVAILAGGGHENGDGAGPAVNRVEPAVDEG